MLAVTASCTSKNGESKGMQHSAECKTALYNGEYENGEEFAVDTTFTADGHFCISVNHNIFAYTEFYRLYSPEGNLLLIASGASESVCIDGYAVVYNDNKIMAIHFTGTLEDEPYGKLNSENGNNAEILKDWYDRIAKNEPEFTFEYDEHGVLSGINPIESPGYIKSGDIEVSIEECPRFWSSDLDGGGLCFFAMYKERNTEGSSQNYLYANGRLAAELAFWKGTFIKLRTYNKFGQMVGIYDDRGIDVKTQVCEDEWTRPQWYVEQ